MDFYSYLWIRNDGTPYYVGKGSGRRAFVTHVFQKRNFKPPKDKSRILILTCRDEAESFAKEIELIRNWGRRSNGTGILHNLSDGGKGVAGHRHSEATKAAMRKPKSPTACAKMSLAKKGRPANNKGIKLTLAQRKKISVGHLGQVPWNKGLKMPPISDERRRKTSEASKRMWLTRSKDGLFKSK